MQNTKARTTAFATFSPYKSYRRLVASFFSLTLAWTQTGKSRQLRFLHSAHFSVVPPWKLRRAGLKGKNIAPGALLFISAYNGAAEAYFRGFSDELASTLNTVWRGCVGWKGASPFANLDAHIQPYQRPNLSFFNVYPNDCSGMRADLLLRRLLDKLGTLALSNATDQEFRKAFDRVSLIRWGDIEPTKEDL